MLPTIQAISRNRSGAWLHAGTGNSWISHRCSTIAASSASHGVPVSDGCSLSNSIWRSRDRSNMERGRSWRWSRSSSPSVHPARTASAYSGNRVRPILSEPLACEPVNPSFSILADGSRSLELSRPRAFAVDLKLSMPRSKCRSSAPRKPGKRAPTRDPVGLPFEPNLPA